MLMLSIALGLAAIAATVAAVARSKKGYEDETGFHFGTPPQPGKRKKATTPSGAIGAQDRESGAGSPKITRSTNGRRGRAEPARSESELPAPPAAKPTNGERPGKISAPAP